MIQFCVQTARLSRKSWKQKPAKTKYIQIKSSTYSNTKTNTSQQGQYSQRFALASTRLRSIFPFFTQKHSLAKSLHIPSQPSHHHQSYLIIRLVLLHLYPVALSTLPPPSTSLAAPLVCGLGLNPVFNPNDVLFPLARKASISALSVP